MTGGDLCDPHGVLIFYLRGEHMGTHPGIYINYDIYLEVTRIWAMNTTLGL